MPTSVGPNTFGQENLVFGYDLGDVSNSYKGEPTTNLATLDLSNTSKWYSEGGTKVLQSETLDGYPVYRFRSSGSLIYVSPVAFNQLVATSNDVTLSAYFKNVGTSTQTVNVFLANDFSTDSNGDPNNRNIPADGKWYRQSWTRYAAANTYNQVEFRTFSDTLLISKPQVEYKKHATPPVEGTRSATQGLLDLTGNSTIDLTNVSFDSNAQMTFDGTDDIINTGLFSGRDPSTDPFTVEAWVKSDVASGNRMWIDATSNGTNQRFYAALIDSTTPSIGIQASAWSDQVPSHTNWTHQVIVMDGSTAKAYADGEFKFQKSYTSYTLAGQLNIGGRSGYPWLGDISMVKIYNRALTASEVKSNYNAIKGRFNI